MQKHIRKILKSYSLVLASNSPRRKELLLKYSHFINFRVVPSGFDEHSVKEEICTDLVTRLAYSKARWVTDKLIETNCLESDEIVLGADTIVVLGDRVLGKPRDIDEAIGMFRLLSDKTHEVITAISLINKKTNITKYEKSYVTFGAFNDKIVYNYINFDKSFDKAGGYGVQDAELKPIINRIEGELDNIIGLPTKLLLNTLKESF